MFFKGDISAAEVPMNLPTARAGAAGAALKASHRETKRHRPLHILSYLVISYLFHISSYLVISSYLCILRLAFKFEIDNVTDFVFGSKRPRPLVWPAHFSLSLRTHMGASQKIGYGSLRGDPYYGSGMLT